MVYSRERRRPSPGGKGTATFNPRWAAVPIPPRGAGDERVDVTLPPLDSPGARVGSRRVRVRLSAPWSAGWFKHGVQLKHPRVL